MRIIIDKTNDLTIKFSDNSVEVVCPEDSITVIRQGKLVNQLSKPVLSIDDSKKETQTEYTDIDEIITMIYDDYMKNDEELSLQFFDFNVKASKGDLINAFIWAEYAINKFYASLVDKPIYNSYKTILYGSSSPNGMVPPVIYANVLEILDTTSYGINEIYKGNYKDFLSTLKKEIYTFTGYDLIVHDSVSLSSLSTILD